MKNYEQNLTKLFSQITTYFSPKIIGEVDGVYIKLAKVKGDDVPWHRHDNEDEMFYVIEGSLVMEIEGEDSIELKEDEFYIVKKGVKHRVYSQDECRLMLIENKSTKHTGNVQSNITKSIEEQM
jgi:mannose-6-phosphate isomerase-like protein (cupin superfamily)